MRLLNCQIQIYEVRTSVHEITIGRMDSIVNTYCTVSMVAWFPMVADGSTKYFLAHSRLEPDCSYSNLLIPRELRLLDNQRNDQPTIVVEIAYTESYDSVFGTVPVYFEMYQVQLVLLIILTKSTTEPSNYLGDSFIIQMHAVLYRRQVSTEHPARVISFGYQLHECTRSTMQSISKVPEGLYTGLGIDCVNNARLKVWPRINLSYQVMMSGTVFLQIMTMSIMT